MHHLLTPQNHLKCHYYDFNSMLSKKAGYHKTYKAPLSLRNHFVIKIWGISGHLLFFIKLGVFVVLMVLSTHTNFGHEYIQFLIYDCCKFYFALVQHETLSYKWAIAHHCDIHCIKTEFYQLKTCSYRNDVHVHGCTQSYQL